jgi:hypothetical protein
MNNNKSNTSSNTSLGSNRRNTLQRNNIGTRGNRINNIYVPNQNQNVNENNNYNYNYNNVNRNNNWNEYNNDGVYEYYSEDYLRQNAYIYRIELERFDSNIGGQEITMSVFVTGNDKPIKSTFISSGHIKFYQNIIEFSRKSPFDIHNTTSGVFLSVTPLYINIDEDIDIPFLPSLSFTFIVDKIKEKLEFVNKRNNHEEYEEYNIPFDKTIVIDFPPSHLKNATNAAHHKAINAALYKLPRNITRNIANKYLGYSNKGPKSRRGSKTRRSSKSRKMRRGSTKRRSTRR